MFGDFFVWIIEHAMRISDTFLEIFKRHNLLNEAPARRDFYLLTTNDRKKGLLYNNRTNYPACPLKRREADTGQFWLTVTVLHDLQEYFDSIFTALDATEENLFSLFVAKSCLIRAEILLFERTLLTQSGHPSTHLQVFKHYFFD